MRIAVNVASGFRIMRRRGADGPNSISKNDRGLRQGS
jgi:hypothetical protein